MQLGCSANYYSQANYLVIPQAQSSEYLVIQTHVASFAGKRLSGLITDAHDGAQAIQVFFDGHSHFTSTSCFYCVTLETLQYLLLLLCLLLLHTRLTIITTKCYYCSAGLISQLLSVFKMLNKC